MNNYVLTNSEIQNEKKSTTPQIIDMQVIPVAGYDSMLLNLSGAHSPFFTRNIVILKDSTGSTGVGEVPGGENIRQTLEDAKTFVVDQSIGNYNNILNTVRKKFGDRDMAGTCENPSEFNAHDRERACCDKCPHKNFREAFLL